MRPSPWPPPARRRRARSTSCTRRAALPTRSSTVPIASRSCGSTPHDAAPTCRRRTTTGRRCSSYARIRHFLPGALGPEGVSTMSMTSPSSRRSQAGSARPILILLLAVVMFGAGALTAWWYLTRGVVTTAGTAVASPPPNFGPLTPTTLAASPEAQASAAVPAVEAEAAPAAPPRAPAAGGGAAPPARRAAKPPVTAPGPAVPAAQPPNKASGTGRSFVLGTTVVESLRAVGRDLQGFDTSGVGVKRAPKVEGAVEIVMQPP